MAFTVYSHTGPTGKRYIGITSMEPSKRWLGGSGYKGNKKFWSDIQKYGWDNFTHEILADGLSQKQAVALEENLIAKYDTSENGYNNSTGGRYGKSGLLSHQCNVMMNALKKKRHYSKKHEWLYQIFKNANVPGDQDVYRRLNLYMPTVVEKMTERGYPLSRISEEIVLDNYIWEFSYLFLVENAIRNKLEVPMYKSFDEMLAQGFGNRSFE